MRKRIIFSVSVFLLGVIIYFLYIFGLLSKSNMILSFMRNFIPDICWTFSFFFMSIIFSKKIFKNYILANSLYVLFIAVLYESFQLFHIVRGTFDIIDLILYSISVLIACLIEKYIWRERYE